MYEDLVKSLKICGTPALINEKCIAFHDGCCEAEPVCMYELMRKAADAIEELSKERKTGEWCADYDGYSDGEPVYDMWWCSACGEYFDEWDDKPTWNYCPNCGAKMIGDDEDV